MAKIPDARQPIIIDALVDKGVLKRQQERSRRFYFGLSGVGNACDRYQWLRYRHAIDNTDSARRLRCFDHGDTIEGMAIKYLVSAGLEVSDRQREIDIGLNCKGHIDGIALGVPESPKKPHLVEIKSMNKSRFNALEKSQSVEKTFSEYYDQVQVYMLGLQLQGTNIDRCLFVVYCKDDDRLYFERIRYNGKRAEALVEKAHTISTSDDIPPPISVDPTHWKCKICDAHSLCHGKKITKNAGCLTCCHVSSTDKGFTCSKFDNNLIPESFLLEGCDQHILHPQLVPLKLNIGATRNAEQNGKRIVCYDTSDGKIIANGPGEFGAYSSKEIIEAINDPQKPLYDYGDDIPF